MLSKEKSIKIIMVGTSRNTRGGIATVVNGYLNSSLSDLFEIRYIATHCDGNHITKLTTAISAYLQFLFTLLIFQPQIIHIHAASRASFFRKSPLVLISRLFGKAIIYHHHGGAFMKFFHEESSPLQKRFIRWILKKATLIIVLSKQWETNFKSIDPSLPILIVLNAVEIPPSPPLNKNPQQLNILFMGRISKRKGVHDLLEAVERLSKRTSNFQVILGGDGDIALWQKECQQKAIHRLVEFIGWVSGEKKTALYEQADIFVLPSYNEGLPMSLLEAIAYGLPVISTQVGGIPEAVTNNLNGFLIKPGDVDTLTDRVYRLLNSEDLRLRMGQASRQRARDKFDIAHITGELAHIYNTLAKQK